MSYMPWTYTTKKQILKKSQNFDGEEDEFKLQFQDSYTQNQSINY